MNMNRLTQKSQEALQDAQSLSIRYGHHEVDVEHLLAVLLKQIDGTHSASANKNRVEST